jgi:hypothetical protein
LHVGVLVDTGNAIDGPERALDPAAHLLAERVLPKVLQDPDCDAPALGRAPATVDARSSVVAQPLPDFLAIITRELPDLTVHRP